MFLNLLNKGFKCGEFSRDVRKRGYRNLSYCLHVLLPQIPLFDAVVDEVPGEDLIFSLFPVHPEVRVDVGVLQDIGPVTVGLMYTKEDIPDPPRGT
jgi:hypothetical protein